jgi:hypothetical protein
MCVLQARAASLAVAMTVRRATLSLLWHSPPGVAQLDTADHQGVSRMTRIVARVVGLLCSLGLGVAVLGAAGCATNLTLDTASQAIDSCDTVCQTCTGGACGPVMNNCGQIVQCDGTCTCTPTCHAGSQCGDPDGCGGMCRGGCPGDDEGYTCWWDSNIYCGDVFIGQYFFCN